MRFPKLPVLALLAGLALLLLWRSSEAQVGTPASPPLAAPPGPAAPRPRGSLSEPNLVEPGAADRSGLGAPVQDVQPGGRPRQGAIGAGKARILVRVIGAPVASQDTARGLRRFNLGALSEGSYLSGCRSEFDLDGAQASADWDVPAGLPLTFGLVALGLSARFHAPAVTLKEGATEELTVDLGHGAVRFVQVAGIPCEAVGGLRVESRGSFGSVSLPGGWSGPFEVRGESVSDPSGRALVLVPKEAEVTYTVGLKGRSYVAGLEYVHGATGATLTPLAPLVTLRSPPGTELFVEAGTLGAPINWGRGHDLPNRNVALLPAALPEPMRVLVDGTSLGMIGHDAWPAGEPHCLEVGDLHWSRELASVTFKVLGFEGAKATLMVYGDSSGFGEAAEPLGPRRSFELAMASGAWQLPVGSVREVDHMGGGPKTLGKWTSDASGVRSCEVHLPPGEYVACLQVQPGHRRVLSLGPFVVGEAGIQTVLLDESQVQAWTIVPRDADAGRCAGIAMPGNLWIKAIKLGPNKRLHGRWPYVGGPEGGPEPSFTIETFGMQPTEARLSRTPGANGLIVPLRPSTIEDAAGEARLVAVVPAALMLYLPIAPVDGGHLGGSVDGETAVPDLERMYSSDMEVVPNSVSYDDEKGLCLSLRSERVTGVISEFKGSNVQVRDWFSATKGGIELASGGRGRFVEVTSSAATELRLRLVPSVRGQGRYLPSYHGDVYPGVVRRLWIPETALRLEWWNEGVLIGSSEDLLLDEIVIE